IQKKRITLDTLEQFLFDIFYLIYLNIMGINQDNQFDTILNKERHITVDYIHQFDGGNLEF
ncbi:MAG: hypothetical protein M5E90_05410, partial [Asgard group archaeon]|nr:hypothetical protein [Asgard group archaeon]